MQKEQNSKTNFPHTFATAIVRENDVEHLLPIRQLERVVSEQLLE